MNSSGPRISYRRPSLTRDHLTVNSSGKEATATVVFDRRHLLNLAQVSGICVLIVLCCLEQLGQWVSFRGPCYCDVGSFHR